MFALFYSLYLAMFLGNWTLYDLSQIRYSIQYPLNAIGSLITNIFGNGSVSDFGEQLFISTSVDYYYLISFILATITSIGIVVMAVKGIKKVFGIFFMGIRR